MRRSDPRRIDCARHRQHRRRDPRASGVRISVTMARLSPRGSSARAIAGLRESRLAALLAAGAARWRGYGSSATARAPRRPRSAARRLPPAEIRGAGAALPRLLRGDVGDRRFPHAPARTLDRFGLRPLSALIACVPSRTATASAARRSSALPAAPPGVAEEIGGFYSAGEFDLARCSRKPHLSVLELGRSCVLAGLSQQAHARAPLARHLGLCAEARRDVMIGCASLEGTDPERLALPLSFLHHHRRAPEEWRVARMRDRRVEMNRMPAGGDRRRGRRSARCRRSSRAISGSAPSSATAPSSTGSSARSTSRSCCRSAAIAARYVDHYGADAGRYAVSAQREPKTRRSPPPDPDIERALAAMAAARLLEADDELAQVRPARASPAPPGAARRAPRRPPFPCR